MATGADKPEETPIDGGAAGYVADAVERMGKLEDAMKELRWRMCRGEPRLMGAAVLAASREARKLLGKLQMVRHCLERSLEE
jgi:hypothetical protein